ncbi:MAG: 23S rRNA (guanosine(2251)-2'-O)-methyltransferase RlmB [Hyphomicrobiaceae bacterium]|nr:23S rRNA (guanosine(2251)-2'-O)-methyltransferase RlmB [Hyphomicrobiaceae bacterium]
MKNRKKSVGSRRNRPSRAAAEQIYGVHAVSAALTNPERQISAVYATRNGLARLGDLIGSQAEKVTEVKPEDLTRKLGRDAVHQGVMLESAPLPQPALADILSAGASSGPLLMLDQVTDPHNVGAMLRSAAAFGAQAAVLTRHNSPPLDGTTAKAASGAVEHVPIILVANLARALDDIADGGLQRIGLDSSADQALEKAVISQPCALVLGAERKGLRRLTREKCDLICRLTTAGPIASLNVSNAAAVALHTLLQRAHA